MKNKKYLFNVVLTSLGFFAAIGVGLFIFFNFRNMVGHYRAINRQFYIEYVDHLNKSTLSDMAEYIEQQYPELKDTAMLKREAGSEWFWIFSGEFRKIKDIFNFSYIYYVEKVNGQYFFLVSSGIQGDEHNDWIGGPVWKDDPPSFVEEAWETRQIAFSREPTVNEWGKNISAALPIISNGELVGILGVDYDISFMDGLLEQDYLLQRDESGLMQKVKMILIFSILIIIVFMGYQIWLSSTTAMVSLKDIEADKRTRLMLESTPMLCSLWDKNGIIIDCDEDTKKIFGVREKSDYLERFYDFTPEYQPGGENTRSALLRIVGEAQETGYKRLEWMTCTLEGDPLPLETTVVKVPWKDEYRFAVYSRDLREDKAKEEALRESENRLRAMVDTMAFTCYFFDSDGQLVDCNQRAVDMFGCKTRQEFLEKFYDLSPELQPDQSKSREKIKKLIMDVFDSGNTIVFNWDHITGDGTRLPVEITLIRANWKNGYRVIAYAKDLRELIEAEDKLRRILATAEASPNFTVFIGAHGNIEYMNPAVLAGSGFSQEELQEQGLSLLFSKEDYERMNREYLSIALKNNSLNRNSLNRDSINFEMALIEKSGKKHDYYFSAFAVQMYDWSTGIGLIGRDVTEQKLTQRELAIAKEQAERALESEVKYNKAKSDFLSRVSHELRTPLNAIIGFTNIAEMTEDKKDLIKCYSKIKESSENLLWLVNDIVDLTCIDTGFFDFSPKPFSFSGTIKSVIENITKKANAKKQEFKASIDSGIHDLLNSDERRLKQILMNLLYNAVKFTPENGKIELLATGLENDGKKCVIRFDVIDNGIGIFGELQKHLGEVFEQEDNSITRKYGGLGLGLSLTKRIVEMMNGHISVESEEGSGSHFICDISLEIASVDEEIKKEEKTNKEPLNEFNLNGKHVLVVDDIALNRDILFCMLEDTGAIMEGAKDGDEAVKLLSERSYDLVLMDLHMPKMDGFTAARNIRSSSRPWAKTVPIISVSAESSVDLHWKCLEAGINEHLAKPVVAEALLGIISKWVLGS